MLNDFELPRLRKEKKNQERAKSPAVEIAMRLSGGKSTEKQLRESLAPFISTPEPPEIVTAANADPLYEEFYKNGFVEEV